MTNHDLLPALQEQILAAGGSSSFSVPLKMYHPVTAWFLIMKKINYEDEA